MSESLAGRCAVLNLHTFARAELLAAGHKIEESRYLFLGGYPEVHLGVDPDVWFPSYVAAYLERDVRNVLRIADLPEFNRFLRACALRTSQMVNYSDLARDTGLAPNTARKWAGLLETSGVVAMIEPYFGNRTQRLIKAPKLVFLDTGLAAFLSGFRSVRELMDSALVGAFWESACPRSDSSSGSQPCRHNPGQLLAHCGGGGGPEVDVVIERAGALTAIECKWGEHPGSTDAGGLKALEAAEPGRVKRKMIVCRTKAAYRLPDRAWVVNTSDALKRVASA